MPTPLVTLMSQTGLFMRGSALTVLIAFTMLILQPAVAAAQAANTGSISKATGAGAESRLSEILEQIETRLEKLEDKLQARQDTAAERNDLKQLRQNMSRLDAAVRENFARIEQHIHDHHLPQVILERHQAMVANYAQELQALTDELGGIETAGDDIGRLNHAKAAKGRLKAKQNKRSQLPFDPANPAFKGSENKVRPPKETKNELQHIIRQNTPVQVAALEVTSDMLAAAATLSPSPVPADLSASDDVQITEDIKALAAQLNHQPVAIYNWVHNNIDYVPTYGSIQGSQMTLDNRRGNAFDTASLLIALLRASNIPARYGYGTVQIPIEKVMNWVGGVKTPMAALDLMGQGGIPSAALVQGGEVKYAKLEHIWVEAWIDYMPSRGAKHKTGDSWVAMDASFKQYDYSQGMDIKTNVPFDIQELLDQILQSAQINPTAGSITGIDQNLIETILSDYQTQVHSHIQQTKTDAAVGDVIGNKIMPSQANPLLASGLPYRLIQSAGNFAVIADSLKHQITFRLYASEADQPLDNPAFSYTTSLVKLGNQRISFVYEPSTDTDKAVIDTAFEDYQIQFPAYLVKMTPAIKIEGQLVAGSGSYTVGTDQVFSVEVKTPWYAHAAHYQVTAGDVWVLGINPAGITPQLFDKRVQAHDLGNGEHPAYLEEMFNQIILGYWAEFNAFEGIIAATREIGYQQLPSHGFAGSPVSIVYSFGLPRWASYKSRILDVKENTITTVHARNESGNSANYNRIIGMVGSYLESGIYDQGFLMEPGYSMSAVTALAKANEQSIPIYHITDANLQTALTHLSVDADIKNDIANAVNAGFEATVSRDPIQVADFTGAGYIITDPVTGSGSYRISGGRDGNNSTAPQAVYPLVQIPSPFIGLLTRSLMRSEGTSLVAENGVILGIALPDTTGSTPTSSPNANIVSVIMVVSMLLTAFMSEINKRYPEKDEPVIYRKYAPEWLTLINLASQSIRESKSDAHTFGKGVVYLALHDKDDVELRNQFLGNVPVACPPNTDQSKELANAYDLPDENSPKDPTLAESFIDIKITRDNILVLDESSGPTNRNGVTEIRVKEPLYREPGSEYRFLFFAPSMIGVSFNRACF